MGTALKQRKTLGARQEKGEGEKMRKNGKAPYARAKGSLDPVEVRVARSIAEVISDSVKELPQKEQERRLSDFCDALSGFLKLPSITSLSSRSGR